MGDSHGFDEQATRILDNALHRDQDTAAPADLIEALAYRAELAVRVGDPAGARGFLARAGEVPIAEAARVELADTFTSLDDLATTLALRRRTPLLN